MDVRRKKFGQRRGDGLLPAYPAREVHIRVHSKARRRRHVLERGDVLARQADRLAQANPRLDAAHVVAHAVVVDDALDPLAADCHIRAVRHDRGVLHRNRNLVVEAIGDPALQLLLSQLALGHHHVERVIDVVAGALFAQLGFEFFGAPGSELRVLGDAHSGLLRG